MSDLIKFDNNQMQIIQTQFFPQNATPQDIDYCMGVAKSMGLNPITKEIWFVERKSNVNGQWISKIEPMAGRDSYIKVAHRSGAFGGMESHCELKDIPTLVNGNWEVKKDLVAVAKVYKTGIDKPFTVEVNYSEYVQRTKQGQPTKFWNDKPHTMIKKVAESQALRKAFNITSVYDEAENRDEEVEYEIKVNEQSTLSIDQLKKQLASKLTKQGFNKQMILDFAIDNKIQDDIAKIQMLLNDDVLLQNAIDNFNMQFEAEVVEK